jgi:hypothetical protein
MYQEEMVEGQPSIFGCRQQVLIVRHDFEVVRILIKEEYGSSASAKAGAGSKGLQGAQFGIK